MSTINNTHIQFHQKTRLLSVGFRFEQLFAVLAIMAFSGAGIGLYLAQRNFNPETGDRFSQIVYATVYLVSGLLMLKNAPRHRVKWSLSLLLLTGLAISSFFWSEAPNVTVRRSIALIGTTLFGYYLARTYTIQEILKLVFKAHVIMLILSLVVVVALPQLGIDYGKNYVAWRGIFAQKNALGRTMGVGSLVSFTLLLQTRPRSKQFFGYLVFFVLSLITIFLAESITVLVSVIFIVGMTSIILLGRKIFPKSIVTFFLINGIVLIVLANSLLLSFIEWGLLAIGKDFSLSGRIPLWNLLFRIGEDRKWLGFGYGGFWLDEKGPSRGVLNSFTWDIGHAHNGLIDVWLDLGWAGVILSSICIMVFFLSSYRLILKYRTEHVSWFFVFSTFVILTNSTQGFILKRNDFLWVLTITSILLCFSFYGITNRRREIGIGP